jgi:hypothetical protein
VRGFQIGWAVRQIHHQFIDKRTFDALAYPASEKLHVLININRQIARGLSVKADEAEALPAGGVSTPGQICR